MNKRNYISPRLVVQATDVQHPLCASGTVKSASVSNVTENGIWGNSPSRRPVIH